MKGSVMNDQIASSSLLEQTIRFEVVINPNRCVITRNRHAECGCCVGVCPTGALSLENQTPVINRFRCDGCANCVAACHTGAIETDVSSESKFKAVSSKATDSSDGVLVVACEEFLLKASGLYDEEKVVSLKCFDCLSASLLSHMALAMVQQEGPRILLVRGDCDTCSYSQCTHVFPGQVQQANSLLESLGLEESIILKEKLPLSVKSSVRPARVHTDVQKRAALRLFETSAKNLAGSSSVNREDSLYGSLSGSAEAGRKVLDDNTLPSYVPKMRRLILDDIAFVPIEGNPFLLEGGWSQLSIDETSCIGCQMCATFCPTGALSLRYASNDESPSSKFENSVEKVQVSGLQHVASKCLSCDTCDRVCPTHSIVLSKGAPYSDLIHEKAVTFHTKSEREKACNPHSTVNKIKGLIDFDYIYER